MKRYFPYILLLLMLVVVSIIEVNKPKPIDWNKTYSSYDKIPYGNYVLFDLIENIFDAPVEVVHQPIYNQLYIFGSEYEEPSNYLFINESFTLSDLEAKRLLPYVEKGNNVFIAAAHWDIEKSLADKLKIEVDYDRNFFLSDSDDSTKQAKGANFVHPALKTAFGYPLKKNNFEAHFINIEETSTKLLGVNSNEEPNFVKINYGAGAFFLSSVPEYFSNYNMLHKNNAEYAAKILSHLPNQKTYWDEYYKVGRRESETIFRYVLSNPALKWLLYMSLLSLVLFMIFEAKRKQRIIPIVEPPQNTTIDFVETISGLYMHQENHKNLADKKIAFLYYYIRSKLYLQDIEMTDDFFKRLSIKSGIEEAEIKQLFQLIRNVQMKPAIYDTELIIVNKRIDEFYQKVEKTMVFK